MTKVKVIKNVQGNGHDVCNSTVFATRFKFPEDLWDNAMNAKYQTALEAAGPELTEILEIPGLVSANVFSTSLYDLYVKKAYAYDWQELEPQIVQLLEERHDRLSALTEEKHAATVE